MIKNHKFYIVISIMFLLLLAACGANNTGSDTNKEIDSNNKTEVNDEQNAGEDDWDISEIEVIITHDLGGSTDATLRVLGEIWAEKLGAKNIIFNNKGGAAHRIGYDYYLQQDVQPDNLKLLGDSVANSAIMYKDQEPDWDWEDSITSLGIFVNDPAEIFVSQDSEFQTIEELIEESKNRTLTVGIASWQSTDNIVLQQIMEQTGADFKVVTLDNSGEVITNVLGGHIDFGYQKAASIARNEGLKVLAITLDENIMPEMNENAPTFNEAMGTDIIENASYRHVSVSKEFADQHPDKYNKLRETFEETIKDERFIEEMNKLGVSESMIVDYDKNKIDEILKDIFEVYEQYKELLEKS